MKWLDFMIKEVIATNSYRGKWARLMEREGIGQEEAKRCAGAVEERVRLSDDPAYPPESYGDWWTCRVDCCSADGVRFWLSVVFERAGDVCFILHGVTLEQDVPA